MDYKTSFCFSLFKFNNTFTSGELFFTHTQKKTAISLAIVELLKKLQSDLRIIKIFLVYF